MLLHKLITTTVEVQTIAVEIGQPSQMHYFIFALHQYTMEMMKHMLEISGISYMDSTPIMLRKIR